MAIDVLLTDMAQSIAGDGLILGALLFIGVAFISFKSGIPLSGMIFLGLLFLGGLVALGLLDIVVFGAVLIIGALVFWRSAVATGG